MTSNNEILIRSLLTLGKGTSDDPAAEQMLARFHAAYAEINGDSAALAQLDDLFADAAFDLRDTSTVDADDRPPGDTQSSDSMVDTQSLARKAPPALGLAAPSSPRPIPDTPPRANSPSERWRRLEPDARREQILVCAIRLFSDRPYPAVSTTDIAQQAGVARGLVNHYFGTKRDLYLEVVRRMVAIPDSREIGLSGESLEDRIDAGVNWLVDRVLRRSKTWLVAVGGVGHDADVERILAEAEELAAERMLEFVGLADVREHRTQLRAMIRAYGGMVKAAGREWQLGAHLNRNQVRVLLTNTLRTLVRDTFPQIQDDDGGGYDEPEDKPEQRVEPDHRHDTSWRADASPA
jgi:AcrR family transcriptional regulator